jgi:hypothetical protein
LGFAFSRRWVHRQENTSFNSRNYGLTNLSDLVRKQPVQQYLEVKDGQDFVHRKVRTKP